MADHEHYMRIALEEAELGAAEGNVAVGSILVSAGKVVARGRNLVTSTSDPTAHAEMVALRHAGKQLGHTDFSNLARTRPSNHVPCAAVLFWPAACTH